MIAVARIASELIIRPSAQPSLIRNHTLEAASAPVQVAALRAYRHPFVCSLVNGLITSDKFCMSRSARLSLSWCRNSELGERARQV